MTHFERSADNPAKGSHQAEAVDASRIGVELQRAGDLGVLSKSVLAAVLTMGKCKQHRCFSGRTRGVPLTFS
jgi:hypothetical protein